MDDHGYERFVIKVKIAFVLIMTVISTCYFVCGLFSVLLWSRVILSIIKAFVIISLLSLDIILLAAIVRNYRNH